jgi:hypothetical protein
MAAGRHNLTRRALLGASAALPVALAATAASASRRWDRALAAYRRAEARLGAFRGHIESLPPERRAYPACEPFDDRHDDLECARLAALRRLLRLPAPDLPALSLKIDLIVDDQAWELSGADSFLPALAADARRLCRGGSLCLPEVRRQHRHPRCLGRMGRR